MRSKLICPWAVIAWCLPLASPMAEVVAQPSKPASSLIVEAGDQNFGETPVIVEVDPQAIQPGRYRLLDGGVGPTLNALVFRDGDHTYLSAVLDQVEARSTTRYTIARDEAPRDPGRGISMIEQGKRIAVEVDGKPWTTYVPDDGPKPYFDPLIGPSDVALTRAWPMREVAGEPHDHPHHRSLWFGHLDVNKIDTWSEMPGHGQIRETSRPTVVGEGGPVAVLRTLNEWLDRSGRKVCEDERVVRFYATKTARVFDFEVTLRASDGPLKIADNKDGVFAVRVAAPMALTAKQGGRIVNSRGVKDKAAWGQPAEWVDYTGPVSGETMGIAILNHPSSFRYPTTWHVRDYGLFAANPFGYHDFGQTKPGDHAIEPGGSIHFAYRVVLHKGATESAAIDSLFRSYVRPPKITVR